MGKEKEKSKKRKRGDEGELSREQAAKLAKKVAKHLKKHSAGESGGGGAPGGVVAAERFVWGKKIEQQLQAGVPVKELTARAEAQRHQDRLEEIVKVQRRREDREAERAQQEEMHAQLQRDRAQAEAEELDRKEEKFHLENAVKRAEQRIRELRPRAIDVLVANLHLSEDFDVDLAEPYEVFQGLPLQEVEDLQRHIDDIRDLDNKEPAHVEWWECLATVAETEVAAARQQNRIDRARLRGERLVAREEARDTGTTAEGDADIHALLSGKTHGKLCDMEADMEASLADGSAGDPEFVAAVLERLKLYKVKARLRDLHADLLERHLQREQLRDTGAASVGEAMGWKKRREVAAAQQAEEARLTEAEEALRAAPGQQLQTLLNQDEFDNVEIHELRPPPAAAPPGGAPEEEEEEVDEDAWAREDNVGQWSPEPLAAGHIAGREVIPEEEDARLLGLLRQQVQRRTASQFAGASLGRSEGQSAGDRAYQEMLSDTGRTGASNPIMRYIADAAPQGGEAAVLGSHVTEEREPQEGRLRAAALRSMGDAAEQGDIEFGGEVPLESKVFWWHEKYRPRAPKYFNRVHTGYEWNKYNQTHYDHDNPPPKVVQGYKFNVFYPDLIDKDRAPEVTFAKDPAADEHGSTCLVRFSAGPPYKDVAFRIINREIEKSHKKGFKSSFERGIMHFYFNFRRQRYRR